MMKHNHLNMYSDIQKNRQTKSIVLRHSFSHIAFEHVFIKKEPFITEKVAKIIEINVNFSLT